MIDVALKFLTDELNTFFRARAGAKSDVVTLNRVVTPAGQYAFGEDRICLSVINIEEERILKSHLPEQVSFNGQQIVREPELKLNLSIILAANFKQYDVGLRYLSLALLFFQSHPFFTSDDYPGLTPAIPRLALELQSTSYEQLNQIWAVIGGKQLPSVIYKARLVTIQDSVETAVQPPILKISTRVGGR